MPTRGWLRRSHSQRREAGRSAGPSADQVRARGQPQDRQGARTRHSHICSRPRRRGDRMNRRECISLVGGAAAWPLAARAQPSRTWRIGYLSATETPGEPQAQSRRLIMEAALARLGYVEGNNLAIDRRLLSEQVERVNKAAAELVRLRPDAIVAVNTPDVAAALSVT